MLGLLGRNVSYSSLSLGLISKYSPESYFPFIRASCAEQSPSSFEILAVKLHLFLFKPRRLCELQNPNEGISSENYKLSSDRKFVRKGVGSMEWEWWGFGSGPITCVVLRIIDSKIFISWIKKKKQRKKENLESQERKKFAQREGGVRGRQELCILV